MMPLVITHLTPLTSLLNRQLTTAIKFHDVLYRFRAGRGAGTAALEAKLIQQLMAVRW